MILPDAVVVDRTGEAEAYAKLDAELSRQWEPKEYSRSIPLDPPLLEAEVARLYKEAGWECEPANWYHESQRVLVEMRLLRAWEVDTRERVVFRRPAERKS